MFITSGEIKENSGTYVDVKLDSDLTETLQLIAESGMGHHLCLVHGDIKPELTALCEILGIQPIIA